MKLYHHKTDGGAEYLTDKYITYTDRITGKKGKEGIFRGSKYIVRIDGDITKDAELAINCDGEIDKTSFLRTIINLIKKTMKKTIDEQFSEIIREKMSHKDFWGWVANWFDSDTVCRIAEDWDEETKKQCIKDYNKKHLNKK